jgi:hypothetical protein
MQFAYALARCTSAEPLESVRRMGQGAPVRRTSASAPAGLCAELIRRVAVALLVVAMLGLAGWVAARALDSTLLGFVFADLLFLVGIALRGAVAPVRSAHSRSR